MSYSDLPMNAEPDSQACFLSADKEPLRVCVAFLDCHTLAQRAANYLILSQNRLQRVFEFSVFNLDRMRIEVAKPEYTSLMQTDPERAFLKDQTDNLIGIDQYFDRALAGVQLARRYIGRQATERHIEAAIPAKWVVFTETRFTDEYYSSSDDVLSVVSLGHWRASMAPPSALEFILRMTQAYCAESYLEVQGHYFTRGCLLDYNEYIQDARLMVLIGNVCKTCRQRATMAGREAQLEALLAIIDHTWIGDITKSDSVASVLKKVFDYDLVVSRGLSPNRIETFWDNLSSSSTQELVRLIAAVLVAYVLFKFGLKSGG